MNLNLTNPTDLWLDDDVEALAAAFDRIFEAARTRRHDQRRAFFAEYYEAE